MDHPEGSAEIRLARHQHFFFLSALKEVFQYQAENDHVRKAQLLF